MGDIRMIPSRTILLCVALLAACVSAGPEATASSAGKDASKQQQSQQGSKEAAPKTSTAAKKNNALGTPCGEIDEATKKKAADAKKKAAENMEKQKADALKKWDDRIAGYKAHIAAIDASNDLDAQIKTKRKQQLTVAISDIELQKAAFVKKVGEMKKPEAVPQLNMELNDKGEFKDEKTRKHFQKLKTDALMSDLHKIAGGCFQEDQPKADATTQFLEATGSESSAKSSESGSTASSQPSPCKKKYEDVKMKIEKNGDASLAGLWCCLKDRDLTSACRHKVEEVRQKYSASCPSESEFVSHICTMSQVLEAKCDPAVVDCTSHMCPKDAKLCEECNAEGGKKHDAKVREQHALCAKLQHNVQDVKNEKSWKDNQAKWDALKSEDVEDAKSETKVDSATSSSDSGVDSEASAVKETKHE